YCPCCLFLCFFRLDPRDLHPSPTRRSSDLRSRSAICGWPRYSAQPRTVASYLSSRMPGSAPASSSIRVSSMAPPGSSELTRMLRSEEHTSELQSRVDLVCRLLLEKKII